MQIVFVCNYALRLTSQNEIFTYKSALYIEVHAQIIHQFKSSIRMYVFFKKELKSKLKAERILIKQ